MYKYVHTSMYETKCNRIFKGKMMKNDFYG